MRSRFGLLLVEVDKSLMTAAAVGAAPAAVAVATAWLAAGVEVAAAFADLIVSATLALPPVKNFKR